VDDAHSEGYQLAPRPWVKDGEALVAWLRARFDEDERVATTALGGLDLPWTADRGHILKPTQGAETFVVAAQVQAWNADHIARFDPKRQLDEVKAKRRILNECLKEVERETATGRRYPASTAWALAVTTLRLLALPYVDRPGYREEWKP
jgi:hypothetical protein